MKKLTILTVLLLLLSAGIAFAFPIDKQVIIQPVQITNNDVTNTTNPNQLIYEAEMDKIYKQAGIDIEFLPFNQWASPESFIVGFGDLQGTCLDQNCNGYVEGDFFTNAGGKSSDPLIINMWFIEEIDTGSLGGNILGVSNYGGYDQNGLPIAANGFVVVEDIFGNPQDNNTPNVAWDVMAHELGHNLGLWHVDDPSGWTGTVSETPENLMSTHLYPSVSIDNIYPDGTGYNFLNADQILTLRSSPFVQDYNPVPEPTTLLLLGTGLAGLIGTTRRRKQNNG